MASTLSGIPSSGVGSLSTLLKRLEAATARLEDIAIAQAPGPHLPSGASALHGSMIPSVNAVPSSLPTGVAVIIESSPAVIGFEALLQGGVKNYLTLSSRIGGVVAEQAAAVSTAFLAQKDFIEFSSKCTKLESSTAQFSTYLNPTQAALMSVVEVKDRNRGNPMVNQLNVVAEGIAALGWITLDSKPGPFISDMKESAQFYANRVVKDNKESFVHLSAIKSKSDVNWSDPKQVEWVRAFVLLLEDLRKYVMEFHTTGLSWNAKGIDPLNYKKLSPASTSLSPTNSISNVLPPTTIKSSSTAPRVASPLGPTPPPMAGLGGVFAALNKGEGVTSGLKKVDKSEMVHKNPELRSSGTVGAVGGPSSGTPVKPPKPSNVVKKTPVMELQGNKWIIEHQENNTGIIIEETEINQIVNVFNVKNSTIQIKGKVNAISIVNCTKLSILVDSTVSSLSISASPSFTLQILGSVPTILLDGTDFGQIFLSKASLGVEIMSSKSSSINISLPVEGEEDGIFVEKSLAEQFRTVIDGGKLVTRVFEHSG